MVRSRPCPFDAHANSMQVPENNTNQKDCVEGLNDAATRPKTNAFQNDNADGGDQNVYTSARPRTKTNQISIAKTDRKAVSNYPNPKNRSLVTIFIQIRRIRINLNDREKEDGPIATNHEAAVISTSEPCVVKF